MKWILLIIIALTSNSYAEVYVNQTTNGGTEYTDTPSSQSKPMSVPPVNTITSVSPVNTTPTLDENADDQSATDTKNITPDSTPVSYKTFDISSPKNEETIQNQSVISVVFNIEPAIQAGDKIQLMLDNHPAGVPSGAIYQELSNVERGTHTLSAVIIDKHNKIIKKSPTITIYVHRNSAVTSPAMSSDSSFKTFYRILPGFSGTA